MASKIGVVSVEDEEEILELGCNPTYLPRKGERIKIRAYAEGGSQVEQTFVVEQIVHCLEKDLVTIHVLPLGWVD
jgi:hypothetical protein